MNQEIWAKIEKEFDKKFYGWKCWYDEKELKFFLRQLLTQREKEILEELLRELPLKTFLEGGEKNYIHKTEIKNLIEEKLKDLT